MSEVDVDAETLREAGESLSEFQSELLDRNNTHLLHGIGQHMNISTGGFEPGVLAQSHLSKHPGDAYKLLTDLSGDLLALSSALHIVADVYETADHEQAMEFAFLNPDAEVPAGLPPDVNADYTVGGEPKGDGDGEAPSLSDGEVPEGGSIRHTYHDSSSTLTTEIRDADGNLVSRKVRTMKDDGGYIISHYNSSNELVRRDYKSILSTGSTYYYSDVYDSNGNSERRDWVWFGQQNSPVPPGQALEWMTAEGLEMAEEELRRHGFDPE